MKNPEILRKMAEIYITEGNIYAEANKFLF